jgi:hypothetical protein
LRCRKSTNQRAALQIERKTSQVRKRKKKSCLEFRSLLNATQKKQKKFFQQFINLFSGRAVEAIETANANKINYVKNKFSAFQSNFG